MSEVDTSNGAVEQGLTRELSIVRRKLEKHREKLEVFEEDEGVSTEQFLEKFESGELGDDAKWFDWKFSAEAVNNLEQREEELEEAVNL